MGLIAACSLLLFLSSCFAFRTEPVTTTKGKIIGISQKVRGTIVDTYHGVPYAKSPTGNLRFKPPVPVDSWEPEVKDATTRRAICPQFPSITPLQPLRTDVVYRDEDCLHLSIWVPRTNPQRTATLERARRRLAKRLRRNRNKRSIFDQDQEDKLSTIVWIYGGPFTSGSVNRPLYDGSYLAASTGVIVVGINYRVGALGFLSLNSDITGNQGLLDQVLGMQFIYDNIEAFGGDKKSITLLGESAGAACVGLHVFSPLSQGLFTRAILESSSPFAIYAATPKAVAQFRGQQYAQTAGCNNIDTAAECLRQLPLSDILVAQLAVDGFFVFTPVIDDIFLPDSPIKLLQDQDAKHPELLLGVQLDEGALFLPDLSAEVFPLRDPIFVPDDVYQGLVQFILAAVGISGQTAADNVIQQYAGGNFDNVDRLDDILGDSLFKCPVVSFADAMSAFNNVFVYSHERRIASTPLPEWMGVAHSYNLEFVFGHPFSGALNVTIEEQRLSQDIMDYWSNFAKSGNPNIPVPGRGRRYWPRYSATNKTHIILDTLTVDRSRTGRKKRKYQQFTLGENLRRDECIFWAGIFSQSPSK